MHANDTPKKGGRPAKAEAARRSAYVAYWVTPDELAAIRARAAASGVSSLSAFSRSAALGVRARPPAAGRYSPEVVAQLRRLGNNVNQCLKEARFGNFPPQVADAAEEALREVSAALRAQFHDSEH